jgi:hypothetical protein
MPEYRADLGELVIFPVFSGRKVEIWPSNLFVEATHETISPAEGLL